MTVVVLLLFVSLVIVGALYINAVRSFQAALNNLEGVCQPLDKLADFYKANKKPLE